MNHFNTNQGLYIRINSNIGYEKILGSLDDKDLSYEVFSQNFIRLDKGIKKLLKSNLFKHGLISIQDPAAGAVVTKDVEPFSLMAGVPAERIGWMDKEGFRVSEQPLL